MPIHRLTTADDDRLADYTRLTDVALRAKHEPAKGLYIAESSTVIRRAVAAGHRPRSLLMAERWLPDLADLLDAVGAGPDGDVPVFVAGSDVLEQVTGFHLHRGALAAMHRPPLPGVHELLAGARGGRGARRVAVLEDVVDHTNVGAIFRSAAGLGVDAVLVSPRCADPLYRRSVRVSMGTVFQVPVDPPDEPGPAAWTTCGPTGSRSPRSRWPTTPSRSTTSWRARPERLALVLGTEGDGLSRGAVEAADVVVRIPMAGGVDSLNVAAASAVAFWATRVGAGTASGV